MRLSVYTGLFLGLVLCAGRVAGHAGHDHTPDAHVETVGEVAPRFYAQSDGLEAVLLFPDVGGTGDPTIYLLSKNTNEAISGADVSAEYLSGGEGPITVTPAASPGGYALSGINDLTTTLSLMIEVSKGDLLEILSVDQIFIAEEEAATAASGDARHRYAGNTIFGLPRYLVVGLLAMNALLVMVGLLAFGIWIMSMFRRGKQAPPERKASVRETSGVALILFASTLALIPQRGAAHAGEDHSGASLAESAALTSGTRHFVPIQTQVEADIQTTRVQERVLPKSFRALGRVEVRSDHRAVVTPPVEGRLNAAPLNESTWRVPVVGATVTKGEVMIVVEQILPAGEIVNLTTERAQVEAELRQARQELTLAAQNKERAERLTKVISTQELQETRAQHQIAQDKVTGLQSRLQTLTAALSGSGASVREIPVLAPISGMITDAHATVGEYVTRDKALFTIVNLDEVFVGADVFESDLQAVQGARTARITLEAFPDESFDGTLHAIGQEIDPETRAVHVLFNVKNPDGKLRGGAFANVAINTGDLRPVIIVPKRAILSQDGVRHVLRKVTPEVFAADPVIVSEFRDEVAVIERGLDKDDRIAVTGLYQIRMSPVLGREQ